MLWKTTYNTDYPYTPYFAAPKTPLKTPLFTASKSPRGSLFSRGILHAKNYLKIAFARYGRAGGWCVDYKCNKCYRNYRLLLITPITLIAPITPISFPTPPKTPEKLPKSQSCQQINIIIF